MSCSGSSVVAKVAGQGQVANSSSHTPAAAAAGACPAGAAGASPQLMKRQELQDGAKLRTSPFLQGRGVSPGMHARLLSPHTTQQKLANLAPRGSTPLSPLSLHRFLKSKAAGAVVESTPCPVRASIQKLVSQARDSTISTRSRVEAEPKAAAAAMAAMLAPSHASSENAALPILERTSMGDVVNVRSPRGQKRDLSPRLLSRNLSSPGMLSRSLSAGHAGGASASRALVGIAAAKVAKSSPIHAGSRPATTMCDHVEELASNSAPGSAGGANKLAALTDLMHVASQCTKMPPAAAAAATSTTPAPAGSHNAPGSAAPGSAAPGSAYLIACKTECKAPRQQQLQLQQQHQYLGSGAAQAGRSTPVVAKKDSGATTKLLQQQPFNSMLAAGLEAARHMGLHKTEALLAKHGVAGAGIAEATPTLLLFYY